MTQGRLAVVALVIVLMATGVNTYIGLHGESRQARDERTTCKIQSLGLEAQTHLTQVLAGINTILQPAPTGKSQPVPGYLRYSVNAIRWHLPLYLKLEAEQPPSRRCP
jgi:hypothetical protein